MIIKDIYVNNNKKEPCDFSLVVLFVNEFFKEDTEAIFYFCLDDCEMLSVKKLLFSNVDI